MPATKTHTTRTVHVAHKSKKISEMLIVMVFVLFLLSLAIFINQIGQIKGVGALASNNYYGTGLPPAVKVATDPIFQPITAPTGQVVNGFPSALTPVNGQVTSSYQNQYNGYNQYSLNMTVKVPAASEYLAIQKLLSKAKFTITQKVATSALYTINAKQGDSYATVELTPIDPSDLTITINYGTPIK